MAQAPFRFPNGQATVSYNQIGRFQAFRNGVGMFNLRDRMIDWLPTSSETVALMVVEMLDKVWASGGRIKPDWSILNLEKADDTEVSES